MKAAAFFASRPRLASAIVLVAVVAGVLSARLLPVALYPTLARPAISVSCSYPGANAVEVMNTVAGPLEEKVNGVEGMDRMMSSCYDTGAYSLTVKFDVGYDVDVALMKVQSKVQQAMSLLPAEVKNTGVTVESGTTEELGILTLRSRDGALSLDEVSDYVFGVVNPAILRVGGVGKSTVKYDKNAVRVWMKPESLAARGLSTEDVVSAIKTQNVQASLGSVGARPSDGSVERVMTLVSKGRLSSPEEFGEIIVATDAAGGFVRLKDVADIGMGPQGFSRTALYGETPAVYVEIYLLPGANPLETMDEVVAELRKLEPFFPADMTWDMTYDTTEYMRRALFGAGVSAAVALVVVLLVLWAALRSAKGVLVVLLSMVVPVSLTVAVLLFAGFQLNLPVVYAFLASLALSAGMSAKVFRDFRAGTLPGMWCAACAAVVAFATVPLAIVDGVQGVIFRQFSVTMASMAVFSAFSVVVVVPSFAKVLGVCAVSKGQSPAASSLPPPPERAGWASAVLPAVFLVLAGLAAYVLFGRLSREFVPDEDMGLLYVDCKTAEGTPMSVTDDVMRRIYDGVRGVPGVKKCATLLGDSIINGSGENQAKMLVVLDDWDERKQTIHEISQRIKTIADAVPEAEVFVLRTPPVKGMGSQGGVTVLFHSIGDNDPVKFSRSVLKMRGELGKSPLAEAVTGGFYTDSPHLRVTVDREKCELAKVPMSGVFSVLQHNLGSIYVNDVNFGTQVNRVTAMSEWSGRASPEDVKELYVRSRTGAMVPVDSLVSLSEELGPRACYRCDQFLYCTEQFIPKPGVSESEAIEEVRRICAEKMPHGLVNDWSGLTYEALKSRGDEGMLFLLAVFLSFLVALAYRESWRSAIRTTLPSVVAVFGAVLALYVSGVPLSVYSRYALIMLVPLTMAMGIARWSFLPVLAALSVLPLAFACGPGSSGAHTIGVPLLGGFLACSLVAVRRLFISVPRLRADEACNISPRGV